MHSDLNADMHNINGDQDTGSMNTVFDKTHRFISKKIVHTVLWFDDFFYDERILDEETARSSIRLKNGLRTVEGGDLSSSMKFHMNIRLKNLHDKLRLIISGENENDPADPLPKDQIEPGFEDTDSDNNLFAGTRYNFVHTFRTLLFAETGLESDIPLIPYLKARCRLRFPLSSVLYIQLAEAVIWKKSHRSEKITEFDLSYLIAKQKTLELNNMLAFKNPEDGIDWGSIIDFRHKLSDKIALSYYTGASGTTQPESVINTYHAGCKFRRMFYRDWLFYEIEPENIWSRNDTGRYISEAAVTLRVEIHFGN